MFPKIQFAACDVGICFGPIWKTETSLRDSIVVALRMRFLSTAAVSETLQVWLPMRVPCMSPSGVQVTVTDQNIFVGDILSFNAHLAPVISCDGLLLSGEDRGDEKVNG